MSTEITRARARPPAPRGCRRCSSRRRTGSRPRRHRAPRAGPPRARPRRPGRTTRSGSRPRSPPRVRTRSRRLLPRAWTTRSIGVGRDVLGADDRLAAASAQRRATARARGRAGPRTRPARSRRPRDVDVEMPQDERPQRRLVLVRERDLLVSPSPPFHSCTRPYASVALPMPRARSNWGHGGRTSQPCHRAGQGADERDQDARSRAQGAHAGAARARARARQRAAHAGAPSCAPAARSWPASTRRWTSPGPAAATPARSARRC